MLETSTFHTMVLSDLTIETSTVLRIFLDVVHNDSMTGMAAIPVTDINKVILLAEKYDCAMVRPMIQQLIAHSSKSVTPTATDKKKDDFVPKMIAKWDEKYKDEAADLVLISSDGVRFRVFSYYLKASR